MSASFPSPEDLAQRVQAAAELGSASRLTPSAMTSFRELASQQSLADSPSAMCSSACSQDEVGGRGRSRSVASEAEARGECPAWLQTASDGSDAAFWAGREPAKSLFPMFIGVGDEPDEDAMSQSAPASDALGGTIRGRALLARRLSVSSLTSLTSIDLTPTHEGPLPQADRRPASKLAADLLALYLSGRDADLTVRTSEGPLKAHRALLGALCPQLLAPPFAAQGQVLLAE